MRTSPPKPKGQVPARRVTRLAAYLALTAVVLFGGIWAKLSRYDVHAFPSPHFSTSVKVARALFHNGLGDEPQALIESNASLPEPEWAGFAPLPEQAEIAGAVPPPFQTFRAPPIEL